VQGSGINSYKLKLQGVCFWLTAKTNPAKNAAIGGVFFNLQPFFYGRSLQNAVLK
jgi:hypothetical protein